MCSGYRVGIAPFSSGPHAQGALQLVCLSISPRWVFLPESKRTFFRDLDRKPVQVGVRGIRETSAPALVSKVPGKDSDWPG